MANPDNELSAATTPLSDESFAARLAQQVVVFGNRLTRMARHLRRWPRQGIHCFRLYDCDVQEVPLAIDRYDQCLAIAEYDRPGRATEDQHALWLETMVRTAGEVLKVARGDIYVRRRRAGKHVYQRVADERREFVVEEGGLRFLVNLSDYLDTGLFLDHRVTRGMVRAEAAGKRFLNLFAYTGAFTVYAAAGDAATTTSVDLSATYLEWAKKNFALNGRLSARHRFVRADAAYYLANLQPTELFDLVVIDPPTFSNSKMLRHDWDVRRDHGRLLAQVYQHLAPGGAIYFSTNSRRFALVSDLLTDARIKDITRQTIPPDFRDKKIHRAWRIERPRAAPASATTPD
ncbi:MAG: class I SAM-dependent methyltransferase [Planctomycetota bacterium]